jgi:hypothetical protein
MTFLWLIIWLLSNTPQLHQWNKWLIGLLVCLAIDALGVFEHESD